MPLTSLPTPRLMRLLGTALALSACNLAMTPSPTAAPTVVPEPISLSGTGTQVVDIEKWEGPALIHATFQGDGAFSIFNYDKDGDSLDLLVSIIGAYDGTRPIDLDDHQTTGFSVEGEGAWTIEVVPFSSVRREQAPGVFAGTGDDVVLLVTQTQGVHVDLLTADAQGQRNFVVYGWGERPDLLFNEVAPFQGETTVEPGLTDEGTLLLDIQAEGVWRIESTTR